MKNRKLFLNVSLPVLILLMLCPACSETDYMTYDASHSGLYFTKDTLEYSFGVLPMERRTAEFRIPVRIMGTVADHDRKFSFEIIADSTTAVEGVQYSIGEPVIPKDSINGYIPVVLLRDGLAGDYNTGFTRYKLGVRLLAGEGFEPTLDEKSHIRVLTFDNAVEQPEWLDASGQKVWDNSYRFFGEWHPLKLIKMVEYFHELEASLPEIYDEMVKLFGENLEHVRYGDFHPYTYVMRKYVWRPMYEFFINPDNKTEITSKYPDFPFDFDDPFTNM